MNRLGLLNAETFQDDQVLETDIMRFMAIIGIVFWIIFSLIKSLPFQNPVAVHAKKPATVVSVTNPNPAEKEPVSDPQAVVQTEAAPPEQTAKKQPNGPSQKGISLQFQSLEELLSLMETGRVRVFARAVHDGFDLFFEAHGQDSVLRFKKSDTLPPEAWEIRNGKDSQYFMDILAETHPAISGFRTKQVLVSFSDHELASRLDQMLKNFQAEGRSGLLTITGKGETVFKDVSQEGGTP
jgi:hypothetical protein